MMMLGDHLSSINEELSSWHFCAATALVLAAHVAVGAGLFNVYGIEAHKNTSTAQFSNYASLTNESFADPRGFDEGTASQAPRQLPIAIIMPESITSSQSLPAQKPKLPALPVETLNPVRKGELSSEQLPVKNQPSIIPKTVVTSLSVTKSKHQAKPTQIAAKREISHIASRVNATEHASTQVNRNHRGPISASAQAGAGPSPSPAKSIGTSGSISSAAWRHLLMVHMNGHKQYPEDARARGEQGTVVLSFILDRSGRILSSRITSSSGSTVLDRATLAMIQRANPLPAPPPEVPGNRISLHVPVTFAAGG